MGTISTEKVGGTTRTLAEVNAEAIQELQKMVQTLSNQISSLQDENDRLKKQIINLQEQIDVHDMQIAGVRVCCM